VVFCEVIVSVDPLCFIGLPAILKVGLAVVWIGKE